MNKFKPHPKLVELACCTNDLYNYHRMYEDEFLSTENIYVILLLRQNANYLKYLLKEGES
jgi:hypothetical protein